MTIMTAADARRITQPINELRTKKDYVRLGRVVDYLVARAVKGGFYSSTVSWRKGRLDDDALWRIVKELKSKGYDVNEGYIKNPPPAAQERFIWVTWRHSGI